MSRYRFLFAALVVLTLTTLLSAQTMRVAPAALPQRLATADMVVIGKVIGFEDKTVEASRFPNDMEKGRYMVAIVKIDEVVLGNKDLKEVRVGFIPPVITPPNPQPGPTIRPGIRRAPQVNLLKDMEACFILTKHADGGFYQAPLFEDVIQKKDNANFDKDAAEARHCAQLLANTKAGLEAKDPQDRFLTAGMLIVRYRSVPATNNPQVLKQEPIDAAQSKAILKALSSADWTTMNPPIFRFTPQLIFGRLGLTDKDGWKPPQDYKQFPEEAKKWLDANADTYRIQRYVTDSQGR
jgi:hypothetical protein